MLSILMLLALAPGAIAAPAPTTVAQALTDGFVQIQASTDPSNAGSILPTCTPINTDPGTLLAGSIQGDCFQATQRGECQDLLIGVDDEFPFVFVNFQEHCYNWLWDITGFTPSDIVHAVTDRIPSPLQLHT